MSELTTLDHTAVEREELKALLENDSISCYSQPIVDLFTTEISAHELLARGTGSFFSPDILFSHAQAYGMEREVELACRDAALARTAELASVFPNLNHFINISPNSIDDPRMQTSFEPSQLELLGIDPRSIVLEITETASVDNYAHFEDVMRYYVEQGLRVALDDFGSGHSGLITLVATTPHFIKIDREIVRGIDSSAYRQNLVRAISSFAGQVGSDLIGEGVETWDELHTLFRLGVRFVQGFLIAKPSPVLEPIPEGITNELKSIITEYHHQRYSIDLSIARLVTMPHVVPANTMNGAEVDRILKRNHSITHVLLADEDHPAGIITRQQFYSTLGSRYGYAVYSSRLVDCIANTEMLVVDQRMDLRTLEKMAMARSPDVLYDPIVVVDGYGKLVGTITMRQLVKTAFDTEIKLATSANPLTGLPGNMVIGEWLEKVMQNSVYSIAYADLDRFKEFNDCYGFATGDNMIKLTAEILSECAAASSQHMKLGHIGGDDFILVSDSMFDPCVADEICASFDERKRSLFSPTDLENGYYTSVNRKGETVNTTLVTLSVAIVTSENYISPPHPGELGHNVASQKARIKAINAKTGRSGYIFERRTIDPTQSERKRNST